MKQYTYVYEIVIFVNHEKVPYTALEKKVFSIKKYFFHNVLYCGYSKFPKISYTKVHVSDKMAYANRRTEGAVWSGSILRNNCIKSKT